MKPVDFVEERAKLMAAIQTELWWILIIILYPVIKFAASRRETTYSLEESTYLFLHQDSEMAAYAGQTNRPGRRYYAHHIFHLYGDVFYILIFSCKYMPEFVRRALETVLKVAFEPDLCLDLDRARITDEHIAIVQLLIRDWIERHCDENLYKLLEKYYPYPEITIANQELLAVVQEALKNKRLWEIMYPSRDEKDQKKEMNKKFLGKLFSKSDHT